MQLAQSRCSSRSDEFQGMLDCLAIATFTCGGDPRIPRTKECENDRLRIEACADGASIGGGPSNGNGSSSGNDSSNDPPSAPRDAGGVTAPRACKDVGDCVTWACLCPDGTPVDVAECKGGKCTAPIEICKETNAAYSQVCEGHMGN
jgi:hypothetical protein